MTDIQAAMGLVELERYDSDMLVKRKHIFDIYSERIGKYDWSQIPPYIDNSRTSSFHAYLLRINDISEEQRDTIISKIFEKQVAVNVHFIPVPMLSFYKDMEYDINKYPVAYDNYSREISLPVYYDLTDEQLKTVADAVIESVEEVLNK
jgi:dTDP-4-amino-4,6-dideoxygalactose transaminase